MITAQQAYIKGLDDSEAITIKILTQLIYNQPLDTFNNPKLESLKNALKIQLDYVNGLANNPKSNLAKYAKKELKKGQDLVDSQP
jgi:hypothetical protein